MAENPEVEKIPLTRDDLPTHLDIPLEFYPDGMSGGMSPQVMWTFAASNNRVLNGEIVMRPWVVLFLLDQAAKWWEVQNLVSEDSLASDGLEMIWSAKRRNDA